MNGQPQPQQQESITKDAAKTLDTLLGILFSSVFPLWLYSRRFGTVGASLWLPGLFIAFIAMMVVTALAGGSLLAWWFSWFSFYVFMAHLAIYLWRHWRGQSIHPYDIGTPVFGSYLGCDITVTSLFAIVCYLIREPAFATWWMANIPLAIFADQMLRQRDFARLRVMRGAKIEAKYRQRMLKDRRMQ